MRAVLDTDVIVAALRSSSGAANWWLLRASEGMVTPVLSVPLALEYEQTAKRPDHLAGSELQPEEVDGLVRAVVAVGHLSNIDVQWRPIANDPGDDMVIEAALNGGAGWIISFNVRHLRPAMDFGILPLTPGEPLRRWRRR